MKDTRVFEFSYDDVRALIMHEVRLRLGHAPIEPVVRFYEEALGMRRLDEGQKCFLDVTIKLP